MGAVKIAADREGQIEENLRKLDLLQGRTDLNEDELDDFMRLCDWRRRMQDGDES